MKKVTNKKGLFLAEILLAVVIAAVIMGAGFLVYNNIQSENDKNTAVQNLNMIISMVNPVMDGEKAATDNEGVFNTYAKAKMLPNTVDIDFDAGAGLFKATSAFGYDLDLEMTDATFSNWQLIYATLDAEQCTKFVQAIIQTKPIMMNGKAPTCGADSSGTKLTGLQMAAAVCNDHPAKTTLKVVYSPNNEDTTTSGAGAVCVAY